MNKSRTQHFVGPFAICLFACFTACFSLAVQAAPVSYSAQLETSKHNPVTDILILEEDGEGTVHGTVYGQDITGDGYAVISHNPAYHPVRSLVIGLTDGEDENGDPKIQLVMFVADAFAVSNQGANYSVAFPGAKHSLTIESLDAVMAGDETQMAWFTDTFFKGPAANAVFDSYGSFSVAEFTALDTIGGAITFGDWTLNSAFAFIMGGQPGSQGGLPTGVLDENAISPGPFDIEFTVDDNGGFAVDKSVTNDTELPMVSFTVEVGTGTGANFVPTADVNVLQFFSEGSTEETTGVFPDMVFSQAEIAWDGMLAPGATANFVFFVLTNTNSEHEVTVRQRATFAREDARATFVVTKDFSDDNPNSVEVTIDCNTGLILDQSKEISEGNSVEFVLTDFDPGELNCSVAEQVPAGYSPTYGIAGNQGGNAGSVTVDEDGCNFGEIVSGQFACQITNTPGPIDIVITKEWVFEGSSDAQDIDTRYKLTLRCDAEIVDGYNGEITFLDAPAGLGPDYCGVNPTLGVDSAQTVAGGPWCKEFYGDGPETFTAQVIPEYPESDCEVVETVYDDAVEVDNGCDHLVFSVGQGASCTITNTVFFEGIPTLSQYNLALLALAMLGLGMAGFRRFV